MCQQCQKPYYVNPKQGSDIDLLCHCGDPKIMSGWQCTHCYEVNYMSDQACSCKAAKPDIIKRIYFRDDKIETLQSTLRLLWTSLFGT